MENNANTAGPLKKISLVFTAGSTPESEDLLAVPEPLSFIFGIGAQGLTRFECVLDGRHSGDKGFVEVDQKNRAEIFGHIIPRTYSFPFEASRFYLNFTITDISDASSREIIKSMAEATTGGCGDGCGCGCGSH